jgi:APA family basic amino acid/polyamine antiporter
MAVSLPPPPDQAEPGVHLHRSLGALFGTLVAVGSMIGVGVLRTPGIILGHLGEAWLALLVWLAGAIYVLLCVNYMAELASAIPRSGGVYVFADRTLGRFAGAVVGWSDFLNSVFAIALLAVALAEYLCELVPEFAGTPALAAVLVGAFTTLNLHGVRLASAAQQMTSLVKLAVLWSLVIGCLLLAPPSRAYSGELVRNPAVALSAAGAIAAFQLVLGAFNGWAAPAYFSGEATDARHGPARALLFGALLVSATYLALNAVILHFVPGSQLMASKLPAADALERITISHGWGTGLGRTLFVVVVVLSLPSTLQAVMMQTSRALHAMSAGGLFPHWGAHVNPRGSPVNATLVCGGVAIILAMSSSFETLFLTFTVFAVLNNLILLCGVVHLRRAEPQLQRPFRLIGYPWTLLPIVLIDLVVFYGYASRNPWQCLLSAAAVAVLYAAYRIRRNGRTGAGPASNANKGCE